MMVSRAVCILTEAYITCQTICLYVVQQKACAEQRLGLASLWKIPSMRRKSTHVNQVFVLCLLCTALSITYYGAYQGEIKQHALDEILHL